MLHKVCRLMLRLLKQHLLLVLKLCLLLLAGGLPGAQLARWGLLGGIALGHVFLTWDGIIGSCDSCTGLVVLFLPYQPLSFCRTGAIRDWTSLVRRHASFSKLQRSLFHELSEVQP